MQLLLPHQATILKLLQDQWTSSIDPQALIIFDPQDLCFHCTIHGSRLLWLGCCLLNTKNVGVSCSCSHAMGFHIDRWHGQCHLMGALEQQKRGHANPKKLCPCILFHNFLKPLEKCLTAQHEHEPQRPIRTWATKANQWKALSKSHSWPKTWAPKAITLKACQGYFKKKTLKIETSATQAISWSLSGSMQHIILLKQTIPGLCFLLVRLVFTKIFLSFECQICS